MSVASWDVVGALTAPANRTNAGSSDLLEDQLFAFGCGSGIVVAEVGQATHVGNSESPSSKGV
jgi:hypothetical protein